jgi:hypothetical protein
MFFRLNNALATFQQMMDGIFSDKIRENWVNMPEHWAEVQDVLQCLQDNHLYVKF